MSRLVSALHTPPDSHQGRELREYRRKRNWEMSHRVAPGVDQPFQLARIYRLRRAYGFRGGGFLKFDLTDWDSNLLTDFSPAKKSEKTPPDKMSLNGSPRMEKHPGPADVLHAQDLDEISMIWLWIGERIPPHGP